MEATLVYLGHVANMVWVHYNKIPIYPIFYLLKGDCRCVSGLRL